MEVRDWKAAPELSQTFRQARELGLESNIAELEAFGFTIVPPEKAAPRDFFDRMLNAVLELSEAEDEAKVSMANRPQAERPVYGRALFHLLHKHPVFAEAAINPVACIAIPWACRRRCRRLASSAT